MTPRASAFVDWRVDVSGLQPVTCFAALQALLHVLGHDPYAEASIWRALVQEPFKRGMSLRPGLAAKTLVHRMSFLYQVASPSS